MVEENKKPEEEKKQETKVAESSLKKTSEKTAKEKKKKVEDKKPKKQEAVVNAKDLPISTKHAIAICKFIRGKTPEKAVSMLSKVINMKRAVPMKGELPHRKGNIMSGRYPINASQIFIKLLRQLAANATINEIELEKARIECKANRASRPYKRFGRERFKRTHVTLKIKISEKKSKEEKK